MDENATNRDTVTRLLMSRVLSNSVEAQSETWRQTVCALLRSVVLSILPFLFFLPLSPQEKGAAAKEENLYSFGESCHLSAHKGRSFRTPEIYYTHEVPSCFASDSQILVSRETVHVVLARFHIDE
jgi:hypothetical protein